MPEVGKSSGKSAPASNGKPNLGQLVRESLPPGTDAIKIGSDIPLHADESFAWCLQQIIAGNYPSDELWGQLSTDAQNCLKPIRQSKAKANELIERFQSELSERDKAAFADLFARMKDAPNPAVTLTMADAARIIDGTSWLWRRWIVFGMLNQTIAEPKVGKSAMLLGGVVRSIVTGCDWPDGAKGSGKPRPVLWCDTERSMAISVERIRNWKLPADLILTPFADDLLRPIDLENEQHQRRIEFLITKRSIPLVVIDALRSGHKQDENTSRMANVLQPLADIAQRTKTAIMIVHHTGKLKDGAELSANSGRGTNAILALIRSQICVDRPDPKSKWARMRIDGDNLGNCPQPIGFRISNDGVQFGPAPERPRRLTEADKAKAFVCEYLKPGVWKESKELEEAAHQQGFSKTTLHRAKTELGIVGDYVKYDGAKWLCTLPPKIPSPPTPKIPT